MMSFRSRYSGASLLALLLLVPLIHGAGAHLGDIAAAVHAADDLARASSCHSADVGAEMSAPTAHDDVHFGSHAAGDFCTLCVTARSTWARPTTHEIPAPPILRSALHRGPDVTLRADRSRGRPDAPRAPPLHHA